jgi:hypothetical protein
LTTAPAPAPGQTNGGGGGQQEEAGLCGNGLLDVVETPCWWVMRAQGVRARALMCRRVPHRASFSAAFSGARSVPQMKRGLTCGAQRERCRVDSWCAEQEMKT